MDTQHEKDDPGQFCCFAFIRIFVELGQSEMTAGNEQGALPSECDAEGFQTVTPTVLEHPEGCITRPAASWQLLTDAEQQGAAQ
jgi:hypothetical protein